MHSSPLIISTNEKNSVNQKKKLFSEESNQNKEFFSPTSPLFNRKSLSRKSIINNFGHLCALRPENPFKHRESNETLLDMMKKSIFELNRKDSLMEKMEGITKENVLKSLISGKFSISQLLDVKQIWL